MVSEGSSRTGLGVYLDLTPAHRSSGGSDGSSSGASEGGGGAVTSALCYSTLRGHNRVIAHRGTLGPPDEGYS